MAKLAVGSTNDPDERAADRVADQVVASIQRRLDAESPAEEIRPSTVGRVRRMAAPVGAEGGPVRDGMERDIASARGGGRAIDAPLRRSMESTMGADFGAVRLHVDERSDQLNRQISAKAFTYGNDIFVRRSDYQPTSAAGQHLLAHELAHTVQQGAAPPLARSFDERPIGDGSGTLQRSVTSALIQREGEDEDDVEDEEEEEEAPTIESVIGDNGPVRLGEQFDEAIDAANEAIEALEDMSLGTTSAVANAKKQLKMAQTAMDEVERLETLIEKQKARAEKVLDETEDTEVEGYDELVEATSEFDTLFPKVKSRTFKGSERLTEAAGNVGLAEDALGKDKDKAAKLAALRGRWATLPLAKGHYDKHKGDTQAASEEDYLTRAAALNDKAAGGTVLEKIRGDGDRLRFDTATGDFTILSKGAKKIRTFFRPGQGKKYYDKQK